MASPEPTDDEEFEITQGRKLPHSYVTFGNSQTVLTFEHSINEVDECQDRSVGLHETINEDHVDLTANTDDDTDSVVVVTQSAQKMGSTCLTRRHSYSPTIEEVSDAETVDYRETFARQNSESEKKPTKRRPFEDELPDFVQKMQKQPKRLKLNQLKDITDPTNIDDSMDHVICFEQFLDTFFPKDISDMLELNVESHYTKRTYSSEHVRFYEKRFFIDEKMKVSSIEEDYCYVLNCPEFNFNQDTDFQSTLHGLLYGMTVMKLKVPTFRTKDGKYLKELKFNLKPFTKVISNTPDGDLFKFNLGFSIPTFSPASNGFEIEQELYAFILIYLRQLSDYYSFYEEQDYQRLHLELRDSSSKSIIDEGRHMGLIQNSIRATIFSNQEQQLAEDAVDGTIKSILIKALTKCNKEFEFFLEGCRKSENDFMLAVFIYLQQRIQSWLDVETSIQNLNL